MHSLICSGTAWGPAWTRLLSRVFMAGLALLCLAQVAAAQSPPAEASTGLQAAESFFRSPDIREARLSPSGKDALMARYGTRSAQQEADALVAVWNVVLIAG